MGKEMTSCDECLFADIIMPFDILYQMGPQYKTTSNPLSTRATGILNISFMAVGSKFKDGNSNF